MNTLEEVLQRRRTLHFIEGGGEMGALIRAKDWSQTSLGDPASWPQNLRATLSIMLNTKFPMFLWWGNDMIQFYNDAYRPSLGNDGKHPNALGNKGIDTWQEIWTVIYPLIECVKSGEATWSEDQLIPIYRNGKLEDVYWTFGYSPVKDDDGNADGVLVICTETTEKVITHKKLEESNRRFHESVMQAPIAMAVVRGKSYIVEIANKRVLELWGKTEEEILNKPVFEGIPEAKDQGLEALLDEVYKTGKAYVANELPVVLRHNGKLKSTYLNFVYAPLRELDGSISGIMAMATEVTEQVLAKQKITDIEERSRLAIEASDLGTFDLDMVNDDVFCSPRFYEIFGLPNDVQHKEYVNMVHPDDLHIRDEAYKRVVNTGRLTYECRIILNDKSIRWIRVDGKITRDENDKPVRMLGTLKDVTDQKNIEEEIKLSTERFRSLTNAMPQQVWTAGPDGNLNYYNQAIYDQSGLTPEKIERDGWLQIVHPADREENIRLWTEAVTSGNDFLMEHRFRRHDGTYRWQLSRAVPQRDGSGVVQQWVGTSTDIHNQKIFAAELEQKVKERTQELINEKQFVETILDSSVDIISVFDKELRYLAVNKKTEEAYGLNREKLLGKKMDEVFPETKGATFFNALLETFKEETFKSYKYTSVVTGRHNETYLVPLKHNDVVYAVLAIAHDYTEEFNAGEKLREANELLEHKNKELENMNKELTSFSYVASHDLQEPLRKIQVFSDRILAREKTLSDTGKDYFNRMQSAALRMQTLINDLLSYSRSTTAERKFELINPSVTIENVREELSETITAKNAIIDIGNMCDVNVIPFQFKQLISNLLSNSLKFSHPNRPPHIYITSEIISGKTLNNIMFSSEKFYCHLSMSDNGIGFEPQYNERIFEVFQRLHGRKEFEGTGIGLAICKKIVENHQGVVTASGESGEGARFDIYLPMS